MTCASQQQQVHARPRNTHLEDADNLDVLSLALSLQEGQHLPDLVRRLRDAVDRAIDVAVHAERERVDRVALEGHLVGRFAGRERPSFRFSRRRLHPASSRFFCVTQRAKEGGTLCEH